MKLTDKIAKNHQSKVLLKFEHKGFLERWRNFRLFAIPVLTAIFQALTGLAAVGLPAYFFESFTEDWPQALGLGVVVVLAFETLKRYFLNKFAAQFFDAGRLGVLAIFGLVLLVVLSPVSSYFGAPILSNKFITIPAAKLDSINQSFDSLAAAKVAFWEKAAEEAEKGADQIHQRTKVLENGVWVTDYKSRPAERAYKRQAAAAKDTALAIFSKVEAQRATALKEYKETYKEERAIKKERKEIVGFGLSAITAILEVFFLYGIFWANSYDYKLFLEVESDLEAEAEELQSQAKPQAKQGQKEQKTAKEAKQRSAGPKAPPKIKAADADDLKEGDIIEDGGKLRILCKKANGALLPYDKSTLATMAKQKSKRAPYWAEQLEKIRRL